MWLYVMVTHGAVGLWRDMMWCKSIVGYRVVRHGDTWSGIRHGAVYGEACMWLYIMVTHGAVGLWRDMMWCKATVRYMAV